MARSESLVVVAPGPATTVQDRGRLHLRRLGVPVAGTLCPDWLILGNGLLGNDPDAAALEFRILGPRLRIEADQLRVVVAGPAEMQIEGPSGARSIPPWTVAEVLREDVVAVGPVRQGTAGLLCVSGGIDTEPVLGARATYARAGIGGFQGRALAQNDRLPVGPAAAQETLALSPPEDDPERPIRVILGPQQDHFPAEAIDRFLTNAFSVTMHVDRMGMRLDGPTVRHRDAALAEIVSDGIVPGAIQVPGNGQPIVLLADGQTVGGYPKIATVISADLPRLARQAPGQSIRFHAVDVAEAEAAMRAAQKLLTTLLEAAHPAVRPGDIDLRRLYEDNLISGVSDG